MILALLALVLALTMRIARAAPSGEQADTRVSADPGGEVDAGAPFGGGESAPVDAFTGDDRDEDPAARAIDGLALDELEDLLERTELDELDELDEQDDAVEDDSADEAVAAGAANALVDAVDLGGAGASEAREATLHRRRAAIGRIDVSVIYRHADPMVSAPRDEVWLLGTWRL